jgi:hypothetical protein
MLNPRPQEPSAPIKLRCPKCKRQNLYVASVYTDEKAYEIQDGRITASYMTGSFGEHISSHARCEDCDHKWRTRDESWKDPAD